MQLKSIFHSEIWGKLASYFIPSSANGDLQAKPIGD